MAAMLTAAMETEQVFLDVLIAASRYLVPVLILVILFRCIKPLLTFRREPEIWAWLCMEDGSKLPITHWENVIGRSKRSDIVIDFPTVSRNHAVLTRYDDGSWSITDADSKDGVLINDVKLTEHLQPIYPEDVISIGGLRMTLQPISQRQERHLSSLRTRASGVFTGFVNLLLLTVLQILCCTLFLLAGDMEYAHTILLGFGGIMVSQWLLLLFYICIKRTSFEIETIAFLLCTMGMAAIATVAPDEAVKQLIAMLLGIGVFLFIGWSLRNMERAEKIRAIAGVAGIGFLLITLVFGTEYYGAKNWLMIGSLSVQPSEFSKVCFVFVGASTMARLMKKANLIVFIGYSAAICGCLALMNDFGTALIFFCAFLVVAYMRSGSVGTLALAIAALVFAGVVVLKIAPHALRRFDSWRHIWEAPFDAGYQQTRALMCMASGGLLGLGAGQGWMRNLFAADSDMVVATICEEWGLLVLAMLVISVLAFGIFAVRSAVVARSSLFTIGACSAAGILLVQVILNALGTVDVLPLTGVTFPFLSNGGSSMICAWGLLAFIKAADTRQNASFAVPLNRNLEVAEDE